MKADSLRAYIDKFKSRDALVGSVGLGYVGLPVAAELGKHRTVVGFDINHVRVSTLIKKGARFIYWRLRRPENKTVPFSVLSTCDA